MVILCPILRFGPPVVASLRKAVDVPLDCHLMIENADDFIPAFADAGANWISVHQEACIHLNRTLELIRSLGMSPGVVINPATPVQTLGEVLDIVDRVLVDVGKSWIWRPEVYLRCAGRRRASWSPCAMRRV